MADVAAPATPAARRVAPGVAAGAPDVGAPPVAAGASGVEAPPVGEGAPLPRPHRRSPLAWVLWALIRLYQLVSAGRPSPCRFWPSCSAYALEAVERHGALKGGWLAARRLSRCHPWGPHGVDPVPD